MRRNKKAGNLVRLTGGLLALLLAVSVTVGVGSSIWSLAQAVENSGAKTMESQREEDLSAQEAEGIPDADRKTVSESDIGTAAQENEQIAAFAAEQGLFVSAWPQELVELLERNPDAEEFVLNYPLKKNESFDIDLSEYENSDTVPLFFQWDERWGYTIYGSNVMGLTGCGPTSLSMVCVYLLQDASYTPRFVADFAEKNGYYVEDSGSTWTLISEGGEALGLDVTEIPLDENRMKKNLELGNPVICIMGPGDFTTTGHFIVLTGCRDGKFMVNDPNSKTNSEKLWSYEELKGQIKNLWVCRLPE